MSSAAPRVTVFMPVHDRAALVGVAIESVLAQTFSDFELLVVDDGSTDGSGDVVAAIGDPRIRLVRQDERRGIPRTRNHGLALAHGEYTALLDSDDWAHPERLERQVAFLDAHRDVAAVGSWVRRVTRDGRPASPVVRPYRPRDVRARMLFVSCFKNPTMMGRTEIMRAFRYREDFTFCSDIDLWSRVSAAHALANLPAFLVCYRLGGDSHQDDVRLAPFKMRVAADQLRALGVDADAETVHRHHQLRNLRGFVPDEAFLDWCDAWLAQLIEANRARGCYPEPEFGRAAAERWLEVGLAAGPARLLTRVLPTPTFARAAPGLLAYLAELGARFLAGRAEGWWGGRFKAAGDADRSPGTRPACST